MISVNRFSAFLTLALLMMLSKTSLAAICVAATLDQYMIGGFSCTVGNVEFSNFDFRTNLLTPDATHDANLPDVIQVMPQSIAGQDGFAFTNLGVYFSGGFSNTNSQVKFTATALSGLITGDSVAMTSYSATGDTSHAIAQIYDGGGALPTASANCINCSSPGTLTSAQAFSGITTTPIYVNAAAQNTSFASGSSSVDGVTALFSTTVVPVPAAAWLFGSGLFGLLGIARRKAAT